MTPPLVLRDVALWQGYLDRPHQQALVEDIRAVLRQAPLFAPITPRGKPMSVRLSSAGDVGWVADRSGYRYSPTHPNGQPWPAIPVTVLAIWKALAPQARLPDCCLINWYGPEARMGLHQDRDEADFAQPVLSISLGDDGLFRIGNTTRGGTTQSVWLKSGDVLSMGGPARLVYHGVDRIRPGSSTLLGAPGRINLTLRVAR